MGTLIDSSVLIATERAQLSLKNLLRDHGQEPVAMAAISASELLHGVHRAATSDQRNRRAAFVEQILAVLPVVPFDGLVARAHASLWAQLARQKITVGAHDLMIGATALALGYEVATLDKRSFPKMPGVVTVAW